MKEWLTRVTSPRRRTDAAPLPLTRAELTQTRRDLYRELSRADQAIQRAMAHADEMFAGDGPDKS